MLRIGFEGSFLVITSIYAVVTFMLLAMTLSRLIFNNDNKNVLTTLFKDIKLSLFWFIAICSEDGWLWLKEMLMTTTNKRKK